MAWGQLGSLRFEPLAGPTEESYKWAVDIAEHSVLGDKAHLQHLGPKLQELTLRIRLHTSLNSGPELDMQTLKNAMEQGDVLDLVIGEQPDSGLWAGQWLITSMDVLVLDRWPGGRLRHVELSLSLKEYVKPAELQTSARKLSPKKAIRKKKQTPLKGPGYEGGKAPGEVIK